MPQIVRLPRQLGAQIHSARIAQNLSQKELASRVGLRQKTISAIENGSEGTKLDTLLSVIAALNLDMQIIERTNDTKKIEDVF